jgi:hypothetical protein
MPEAGGPVAGREATRVPEDMVGVAAAFASDSASTPSRSSGPRRQPRHG